MKDKSVFEYIEILIDSSAGNLRIVCYIGKIHDGGIAQRRYLQKPAEGRNIACQPLGDDFLLKIEPSVSLQIGIRVIRKIYGR